MLAVRVNFQTQSHRLLGIVASVSEAKGLVTSEILRFAQNDWTPNPLDVGRAPRTTTQSFGARCAPYMLARIWVCTAEGPQVGHVEQ